MARSSSSERASISGSKAATSGTIDSTSLSFRPSPACRILLKRPMWPPSVPTGVADAAAVPLPGGPEARRLLRSGKASAATSGPARRSVSMPVVATAVGQDPELQIGSEPPQGGRGRRRVGGVVAAGAVGWGWAGGAGARHPPHGEDVMAYLVRADFALPNLVAHGRLDGWLPRFYLGYQEFLFNGPGVTWAMAALRGVTFGALSN